MIVLTLDAETYYDQEYSLSKMPTTLYIRDPRFHCWGAAAKFNDGPSRWVPGDKLPALFDALRASDEPIALLGQNTMFDAAIYAWRYGWVANQYIDIMGMSRACVGPRIPSHSLDGQAKYWGLPGKVKGAALSAMKGNRNPTPTQLQQLGMYACDDSDQTWEIYTKLLDYFPPEEFAALDWTIRMFTQPQLRLDSDVLADLYNDELDKREALLAKVNLDVTQIRSNDQFAELLEGLGVLPPTKISKTTQKVTFAFSKQDQEFMDLLEDDDPQVRALVEARLGLKSSIVETRTASYWRVSQSEGLWPVDLQYSGAQQTHRLSGGKGGGGNVQNMNRPTKLVKKTLRHAIRAPNGYVCVVGDSSQVELRVSAKICGQEDILTTLQDPKGDIYASFASDVYGFPVNKNDHPDERQTGKVGVLSLGYQSGGRTFQRAYAVETRKGGNPKKIALGQAQYVVDRYRSRFDCFPYTWAELGARLRVMCNGGVPNNLATNPPIEWGHDYIRGPSGLCLKYPEIGWRMLPDYESGGEKAAMSFLSRSKSKQWYKPVYGGALLENLSQFLTREIMNYYLQVFLAEGLMPAMQVHDEYCFVVPEAEADDTKAYVKKVMSLSPPWWPDLPLACDVGAHEIYGMAK